MKTTKLITIAAAIAAITTSAHAELTAQEFKQMTNWAETRGLFFEGIDQFGESKTDCFVFSNRQPDGAYRGAFVPVSSDTADEAINALIASSVTLDAAIKSAQQVVDDVRRETAAPARVVQQPEHKRAGVPPDVLHRIRANAERQWADDYDMQKYVIEKQVRAYQDLNN